MLSIRPSKPALFALLMFAGLAVLWPAQPAQADSCTINWNTNSSGNFDTASNWDLNRVPSGADKACINRPVGNPEVTIPAGYTATLAALTNRDGWLSINGALVITGNDSILASQTVIDRCSGLLQIDAGAGLSLEGDAADFTWSNSCPVARIVVSGTLNKTGGGTSTFNVVNLFAQGGTLSATEGTLAMGNGSLVSATLNAGISGTVLIQGYVPMSGALTGSGAGRVEVNGNLVATGTQAILNFPDGLFRWTGGYIDGRYAPITNTGFIKHPSGSANLCGDVRNSGTFDVEAPVTFDLQTATLTNLASGTINLRGDSGDLSWQNGCYDAWPTSQNVGILRNYGALNKTDGGNSSIVNVQVKTVGGSVRVESGALSLANQPHLFENADIVIDAGASINADASGGGAFSVLAMSGTVTGTGAGQLVLAQRLQAVGNGARLNFAPGWLTFGPNGAELDGYAAPITNVNRVDLPFNASVTVCGVFDNLGVINIRGIWNQDVRRTRLNNAPNGVINLIHDGGVSSAGIFNWGNCAASISESDGARVVNRGRIVKTGSGASRITNSNLDVIGGSLEVLSGTLGGDGLSNFSSFYQNASITVAPSATLAHCYPARVEGSLTASGGGLVRVAELRGFGAGGDVDMPAGMLVMQNAACAGYTSTGIRGSDAPLNIRGAIQNEAGGDFDIYGFVTASPGAQFRMTGQRSLVIKNGAVFQATGSLSNPVMFVGAVPTPTIGVWREIRVDAGGQAQLDGCVIRDGGNPGVNAAIYNYLGILRIERCSLDGPGIGLYSANGNTDLHGNSFARGTNDNQLGNGSAIQLDARNNWWGHPSGPYHATLNPTGLGITVTGNVLFTPWATGFGFVNVLNGVQHGDVLVSWRNFAAAGPAKTVAITATGPGGETVLGSNQPESGELIWNARSVPSGRYELLGRLSDGSEDVRVVTINNAQGLCWHDAPQTISETWSANCVHVVLPKFAVNSGVIVTVEAGTVVKHALGGAFTVQTGGQLVSLSTVDLPVIFTSSADDDAGGDTNLDGPASLPTLGDWRGFAGGGAQSLADATQLRYLQINACGTLPPDTRWAARGIYRVTCDVIAPGALTIEPGVIVKFDAGRSIRAFGRLLAAGTLEQPIVFTSVKDDDFGGDTNGDGSGSAPAIGDWGYVQFSGSNSRVAHVIARYGGANGNVLFASGGSGHVIEDSMISDGAGDGLVLWGGGYKTVSNTIVTRVVRGINVEGSVDVVNSTIHDVQIGVFNHGGTAALRNTTISAYSTRDTDFAALHSNAWDPVGVATTAIVSGANGNLRVNPQFVNAAANDFRLKHGSRLIDAGVITGSTPSDYYGVPRGDDSDSPNAGSSPYPDIGAVEYSAALNSDLDLVVDRVRGPANVTGGTDVLVEWAVTNAGAQPVQGPWRDEITLSNDNETLSGVMLLSGNGVRLAPGQRLTRTAIIKAPYGVPGVYAWQVRTNATGALFEGANTANNTTRSTITTTLSLPRLELNGPVLVGNLEATGSAHYFELDAPNGAPVIVEAMAVSGAIEMHAGRGTLPTSQSYLLSAGGFATTTQRLGLSGDPSAGLFVRVFARAIGGSTAFTISARMAPFALEEVRPKQLGNDGEAVVQFAGSGFVSTTQFALIGPGGAIIPGSIAELRSHANAFATFDLTGVAAGAYGARITNIGNTTRTLSSAVTVTQASADYSDLTVSVKAPKLGRGDIPFMVTYANEGDKLLLAPILSIESSGFLTTTEATIFASELTNNGGSAPGASDGARSPDYRRAASTIGAGLSGALAPGELGKSALLAGRTNTCTNAGTLYEGVYVCGFVDYTVYLDSAAPTTPVDWRALFGEVKPDGDAGWDAAIDQIAARYAPNAAAYHMALGRARSEAARNGETRAESVREIMAYMVRRELTRLPDAALSGTVIDDATGKPAANAHLLFEEQASGEMFAATSWYDGRFAVVSLPAGDYTVWAVDHAVRAPLAVIKRAEAITGLQVRVVRDASGVTSKVSPQELNAGVISGFTYRLSDGARLGGALLEAYPFEDGGSVGVGRSLAREDVVNESWYNAANWKDGPYAIRGNDPGAHLIVGRYTGVMGSYVTTREVFAPVIEIGLAFVPGADLAGDVRDANTGLPIAGARVRAERNPGAVLTTTASGAYSLTALLPGETRLSIGAQGYLNATAIVTLSEGANSAVSVLLKPESRIALSLQTPSGDTLPGVAFQAMRGDGTGFEGFSNTRGVIDFRLVDPDVYTFTIANGAAQRVLTVPPAGAQLSAAITLSATKLTGNMTRADGSPAVDTPIYLARNGAVLNSVDTDGEGHYTFVALAAGAYQLIANGDAGYATVSVSLPASGTLVQNVALQQSRTLNLGALGSGVPVTGALVVAEPVDALGQTDAQHVEVTLLDGRAIFSGLAQTRYTVTVAAAGWQNAAIVADLTSGNVSTTLALTQAHRVFGVVRNANGARLAGATVYGLRQSDDAHWSDTTDAQGNFDIDQLPPGAFELVVVPADGGAQRLGISPVSVAGVSADLVLANPGYTLTGSVRTQSGGLLPNALLNVRYRGVVLATALSGLDGAYTFNNLPAGNLVIETLAVAQLPQYTSVSLSSDRAQQLTAGTPLALHTPADIRTAIQLSGMARALEIEDDIDPLTLFAKFSLKTPEEPEFIAGKFRKAFSFQHVLDYNQAYLEGKTRRCPAIDKAYERALQSAKYKDERLKNWREAWRALLAVNRSVSGEALVRAAAILAKTVSALKGTGPLAQFLNKGLGNMVLSNVLASGIGSSIGLANDAVGNARAGESFSGKQVALNTAAFAAGLVDGTLQDFTRELLHEAVALQKAGNRAGAREVLKSSKYLKNITRFGPVSDLAGIINDLNDLNSTFDAIRDNKDSKGNPIPGASLAAALTMLGAQDNWLIAYQRFVRDQKALSALIRDCGKPPKPREPTRPRVPVATGKSGVPGPHDPNDKRSTGFGPQGYVRDGETLHYSIRFENVVSASAAARAVFIDDQLDARLDWSTLELAHIAFNDRVLLVPPGLNSYATTTTVGSDEYPVRVSANIDPLTGLLRWSMETYDAAGNWPDDIYSGFLPPNLNPSDGEGSVGFSIRLKPGLADGTVITNIAKIVFETNDPIWTPPITNTIDASAPVVSVSTLPTTTGSSMFTVSWGGSDAGSGIQHFDVYTRSANGDTWLLWQQAVTTTSATYTGANGASIQFFAMARDNVLNRAARPTPATAAQAATVVSVNQRKAMLPLVRR
jgi:hypothetical protein